jgi:hypothetical protein
VYRRDQFEEEYILRPKRADEEKESVKLNNSTQTLGISSVLITTVAFGAAFAPPGGYVADDHAHGGTPTLAGSYAFEAFTMANMLAFTCSAMGTIGLMYSGITTVDLPIRQKHFSQVTLLGVQRTHMPCRCFRIGHLHGAGPCCSQDCRCNLRPHSCRCSLQKRRTFLQNVRSCRTFIC